MVIGVTILIEPAETIPIDWSRVAARRWVERSESNHPFQHDSTAEAMGFTPLNPFDTLSGVEKFGFTLRPT
jgi:hypothetical protein